METGSRRVLVIPRAGGGWELRETRTGPVLARSGTKGELVARARLSVGDAGGGEVVVLSPDGTVQSTLHAGPSTPRPWWYVRPGLLRWLLPSLFGVQLGLRLVAGSTTPFEIAFLTLLAIAFPLLVIAGWRSAALDRARATTDPVP